jgi:hypothetical protein
VVGHRIDLTAKEFGLLEYFMRNRGRVVSRVDIAEKVWDIHFDTGTNTIDVYVNFLRKKIDRDFSSETHSHSSRNGIYYERLMNIRLRLTILFAVLVASIMLVFSLSVYYLYDQFREQEFNNRLREKALTTVRLLEDVGGITEELLHAIDRNNLTTMYKEEVTVYNVQNQVIYDSGKEPFPVNIDLLHEYQEWEDFSAAGWRKRNNRSTIHR